MKGIFFNINRKVGNEDSRKSLLIFLFGSVGMFTSFYFLIEGFFYDRSNLYISALLMLSLATFGSMIVFLATKNYKISAHIIIFSFLIVCLLLFAVIGIQNSGVLWFFVFSPMATLMTDYKKGLLYNMGIYLLIIFFFFNPFNWNINVYPDQFMVRFLIAFPIASTFILISEYTRTKTQNAYRNSLIELRKKNVELVKTREELKGNLQRIKDSESELKELNATKDKFFSIVAHDLKNPFNPVLGFTELLLDEFDELEPGEIKSMLQTINSSSQKIYKLLENLLTWSRVQLGRIKYEPNEVLLSKIIDNSVNLLKESAENKSIQLCEEIDKSLVLIADERMLNTVIQNLISNAIKFTPKGGSVTVKAYLEKRLAEKLVHIEVQDSGVGILDEMKEKLFDVENNKSTPGTDRETGTGLGLIICKEFIDQHAGEIYAESELGKGSIFHIKIPHE